MKKLLKKGNDVGVMVRLIAFILFSIILIYGLGGASDVGRDLPSFAPSDSITDG